MYIYCTYIHILIISPTHIYRCTEKKVTVTNWNLRPCCLVVSCRCTHHWNETKVTSLVLRGNGRCAQKKSKLLQAEKDKKSRNQNARCLQKWVTCTFTKKNELQIEKNFGTIISNVDSLGQAGQAPLSWIFFTFCSLSGGNVSPIFLGLHPGKHPGGANGAFSINPMLGTWDVHHDLCLYRYLGSRSLKSVIGVDGNNPWLLKWFFG